MVPDDKSGSSVVLPLIRFQGLLAGKLEGYHSLLLFAQGLTPSSARPLDPNDYLDLFLLHAFSGGIVRCFYLRLHGSYKPAKMDGGSGFVVALPKVS